MPLEPAYVVTCNLSIFARSNSWNESPIVKSLGIKGWDNGVQIHKEYILIARRDMTLIIYKQGL